MKRPVLLGRANRWAAWVVLAVVAAYVVTGYGMTRKVLDPDLAKWIHERILPLPLFFALAVHGGLSARHALRRRGVFESARACDLFVGAAVAAILGCFLWLYAR